MTRKKDLIQKSLSYLGHVKETVTAVLPHRARKALADAWCHIKDRYDQLVDALEPDTANDPDWPDDLPPTPYGLARKPILIGVFTISGFLGVAMLWGLFAQLNSAAVAIGIVAVDTNRKAIQHLEGGIVKEILVGEGTRVKEGDVLLRLDDTRTSASVELVLGQYRSALAQIASLRAEQKGLDGPQYPDELTDNFDISEVAEIIAAQNNLFQSRRQSLQSQVDVLNQQVKQFEEEIAGLKAQKNSQEEQLELIKEEIVGVRELYEKGLERKPRLLALQRKQTEIGGQIGQYQANIARARQSILENELNIQDLLNRKLAEVAEQLRIIETEKADFSERLRAIENQQMRTEIVAPRSGIVVNLKTHTIGGVIQPGETILELVPIEDTLIVQARVNPRDIDVVRAGMSAQVVLTAYNTRRVPYLDATVQRISADILRDEVTGENYYEARIEVDLINLEKFPDIMLYPGMPVEVMIVTGERTPLQYLLAPFKSSLRRAAREL